MLSNKDTETLAKVNSQTRTAKIPLNTETGSLDSTKPTSETLNGSEKMKLEEEAKQFTAKKRYSGPPKPMTSRIYLTGMAMNALLSRAGGFVRKEDIKREAEEWADFFLED
jgi:hypothetical protein